jgi:hypothetical protein
MIPGGRAGVSALQKILGKKIRIKAETLEKERILNKTGRGTATMNRQETEESLCLELASAQVIAYRPVFLHDWSPAASACHENVDRWVSETIGNVAVRGWVVYMPSVLC